MEKPIIVPNSYQLQDSKYVPQVILRFSDGLITTDRPLSWEKEFDTKEEANRYASLQAELYIKKTLLSEKSKG